MAAVTFEELSKVYKTKSGEITALDSVSFEIPEGQIFGFAGPNGAGKSTAIKILVGLLRPTSGKVTIFDYAAGSLEARRILGFLPEVTLYHDFMGAEELLKIHAKLAKVPAAERQERCDYALSTVGLADRKKSRLSEFSKGMKQRFGIAQALVGKPKLLVLDELTSGLDPLAQASLLELLEVLKAQGITIFFSSHHLQEIERICDSAVILHEGVVRAAGPLDDLLGDQHSVEATITCEALPEGLPGNWVDKGDGSFDASLATAEGDVLLNEAREGKFHLQAYHHRRQTLEELFLAETGVAPKIGEKV